MRMRDAVSHGHSLRALPGLKVVGTFKKSDVMTRAVAGCCDSKTLQVALGNANDQLGSAPAWLEADLALLHETALRLSGERSVVEVLEDALRTTLSKFELQSGIQAQLMVHGNGVPLPLDAPRYILRFLFWGGVVLAALGLGVAFTATPTAGASAKAAISTAFIAQPPLFVRHSSTSAQVRPSPVKPAWQAQVRDPGVLVQVALTLQPPLLVAHSFTSVQVTPSPVKPVLHVQVRDPDVLAQVALASQPPLVVRHSFTSAQVLPSPV